MNKKLQNSFTAAASMAMVMGIGIPVTTVLAASSSTAAPVSTYGIQYEGHVQNKGWMPAVTTLGEKTDIMLASEAGTDGKSLRVEALKLTGTNLPAGASITYQVHVQNKGWMPAVTTTGNTGIADAKEAGTHGLGLRAEAIKITLKGLPGYAVKYQTHVQNKGWMTEVQTENDTDILDAKEAGTDGQSLRMEALRIELVKTDVEKAAEVKAIDAVTAARGSKTTVDIAAATTAINLVQDITEKAILTVENEDIDASLAVSSVSPLSATVTVGNKYTLPATVQATLADGTTKNLSVVWNKTADTTQAGTYKFTGILTMVDGVSNTANITVTDTLTVTGAPIVEPSTITVNNSGELTAALADSNVTKIILGSSFASDANINRKVDLDLNGSTLTGNVSFVTPDSGIITLGSGIITGSLTVNTPNASFVNNANVSGTTTIANVASHTFTNNGILASVLITDADGTDFVNNATVGTVTVDTNAAVTLGGIIPTVLVQDAGILTVNGTVAALTVASTATGASVVANGDITTLTNNSAETAVSGTGTVDTFTGSNAPVVTPSTVNVGTVSELNNALGNSLITDIKLENNLTDDSPVIISRPVLLDGNGMTLTLNGPHITSGAPLTDGLGIFANATIKDLDVTTAPTANKTIALDDNLIEAFGPNVTATLDGITISGSTKDGMYVEYGAKVVLQNSITLDDNAWGGIEVQNATDKSNNVTFDTGVTLTYNASVAKPTAPVVYVDANVETTSDFVTDTGNVLAEPIYVNESGQNIADAATSNKTATQAWWNSKLTAATNAVAAVNAATDENTMSTALTTNATVLGLATGTGSVYAGLNNPTESGRQLAVASDVFNSKVAGTPYTSATIKATFDRAVQSRNVIKNVMLSVYNAQDAAALGNVIQNNFYTDLITDLTSAQSVYTYQGNAKISDLLNETTGLPKLFADYNALTVDNKATVNAAVFESQRTTPATSWTGIYTKITTAIAAIQ